MKRNFFARCEQFVKDQGGMEALQTVCIVAIAATVMIGAAKMGSEGKNWMNTNWKSMKEESDKGLKEEVKAAINKETDAAVDKVEAKGKELLDKIPGI